MDSRLLDLRKKKGLTQNEVGQVLGVSGTQYGYIESGKRSITQANALKLAEFFNVSVDYILGKSNFPLMVNYTDINKAKVLPEYNKVPIVGSIACSWDEGFIEEFDGEYTFINDHLYSKYGNLVRATIARGTSMKDMISPGDLLLVVPAADVENNDIVIAKIGDDEITAKKFHYNAIGGFDLIPNNPEFGIQSFSDKDVKKLPVQLVARVVEIRKGLRS